MATEQQQTPQDVRTGRPGEPRQSVDTGATGMPARMEPVYQANSRMADVMRQQEDDPQAQLTGSGILIDNGWDRIFWRVDDWEPGVMTLQLVLDTRLWAWKSIVVTTLRNTGNWEWVREIAVNSNDRVASAQLYPGDLSGVIKLDFWKHGFLGAGRWVTATVLDTASHLGKSIQFTVDRD